MELWLIVFIIVVSVLLVLGGGVFVIWLCKRYSSRGMINLLGGDNLKGSYGTSSKLWIGGNNPTEELLNVDMMVGGTRIRKTTPEEQRSEEEIRRLSRVASNFCRSTAHERALKTALPHIGRRQNKFCAIVSDAKVNQLSTNAGGFAEVNLLLTIVTPEPANSGTPTLLPMSSAKSIASWRSLLCGLDHPHVLRTFDAAVNVDGSNAFIVRPFVDQGSLRDALFAHEGISPLNNFSTKYLGEDQMTRLTYIRPGRGLNPERVALYSKQILEGLRYLESQCVPMYALHSGNVLLRNQQHVVLSDYENAFFGSKNRLHKKIRRLPKLDPIHASFVCLIYELCTGVEPLPWKKKYQQESSTNSAPASPSTSSSGGPGIGLDLVLHDARYAQINAFLQHILHASHAVTFDELLANQMFHNVPSISIPRTPSRTVDSRTARLLQPILDYYQITVYPGHPTHAAITLPMKISTNSSAARSSNAPDSPSATGSYASDGEFDATPAGSGAPIAPMMPSFDRQHSRSSSPRIDKEKKKKKKQPKSASKRDRSRGNSDAEE